jgi:hypothetical protein
MLTLSYISVLSSFSMDLLALFVIFIIYITQDFTLKVLICFVPRHPKNYCQ